MQNLFRINNFDLIRLIAALQVAFSHTMSHLNTENSALSLISFLSYFPGVPIFFFVSGFLISKSYERNPQLREYAKNRIVRIYPALIVCVLISLVSVYLTGYLTGMNISVLEFCFWIFSQLSFFQFYGPDFMREFGTGVMNGSLWTVSVELQFYIVLPFIYWILGLTRSVNFNRNLLIAIVVFMIIHILKYKYESDYGESVIFKVFGVSFYPWVWMFLVGVFCQKNFLIFHKLLSGRVLYVLPLYLITAYFTTTHLGWSVGNGIHPVLFVLLSMLVFSLAYSFPSLSQTLLKNNDISYGIYIYHIPIINLFIYFGYVSEVYYVAIVLVLTIAFAILSWVFLEKYALRLKKRPMNPLSLREGVKANNDNDAATIFKLR